MSNSTLEAGTIHKLPADLAQALKAAVGVTALWNGITPIGRNEFICWVENAKQEKTRVRRIKRTVEELQDGQKRPCCWAGCIHRTDKKPSNSQRFVYKLDK